MKKSKKILSIFLAVLMIALSSSAAFANNNPCTHTNMHYVAGSTSDLCDQPSFRPYWVCNDCGSLFLDQDANQPTTMNDIADYSNVTQHDKLYDIDFNENANLPWLSVDTLYDLSCYISTTYSYLYFLENIQGVHVSAFLCSKCGVVITVDHGGWTSESHPGMEYHLNEPGVTCAHERLALVNRGLTEPEDVLCGRKEIKECWHCLDCGRAFVDQDATQVLTSADYGQYILTAPHNSHSSNTYEVTFEDQGNGRKWLSTTSYNEKLCQDAYGMSAAEKFTSDGYKAYYCEYCGVYVENSNDIYTIKRPEVLGFFVNPIPELEGAVKIPLSPQGLAAGERWMDWGSYINLYSALDSFPKDMLADILFDEMQNDFYFNETTGETVELDSHGAIYNLSLSFLVRSVGDTENAVALPSSPEGLNAGDKWFDAASVYHDAMAQFVPTSAQEQASVEQLMSYLAVADFALSPDGTTIYASGNNAEIAAALNEGSLSEYAETLHGGDWFIELNALYEMAKDSNMNIQLSDYIKTVAGACDHVWNNGERTKDPTCTAAGTMTYTCANGCGATRDEIIPALGHDWNVSKKQSPTITDTGLFTYTCSRCAATKTHIIPKLDPAPLLNELNSKQDLKDTNDDATVFFDADANLPADTVFDCQVLESTKWYQIFDLKLISGGKEVEPEAPVWVKMPVPKGWNPNLITVWHGAERLPSFTDGAYIYFLTSHFSEFEIKCEEENEEENNTDNSGSNDNTNPQPSGKVCKYCGQVHNGFFQKIIGFFHSILALFGLKKK